MNRPINALCEPYVHAGPRTANPRQECRFEWDGGALYPNRSGLTHGDTSKTNPLQHDTGVPHDLHFKERTDKPFIPS